SDGLFDFRHVAGDALTPRAVGLVMRMGFDARGVWTISRVGAVAVQANFSRWLPKHSLVRRAMNVVATETGDAARIHQALHEVIPLHAVLVGGSVGKVRE